jgi:hypothetical protein
MGPKEGRAFYWRTPGGSNDEFFSLHEHLATQSCHRLGRRGSSSAILGGARVG